MVPGAQHTKADTLSDLAQASTPESPAFTWRLQDLISMVL